MEALVPLALLACPVGMGLMMWFMMRGGKKQQTQDSLLPDLKAEQARLAEKISVLEQQESAQTPQLEEVAERPAPAQVR